MEKSRKSDKYKGVYLHCTGAASEATINGYWQASKMHKGVKYTKNFPTEREAAIAYDKWCLDFGLPAENILKPAQ